MDKNKARLIIKEWVKLETQLTILKDEHKKINKKFKEQKNILLEKQKKMELPIIQLMNEIDTESITLSDKLSLNTKPVTKTTGLTKSHIKERLDQYFDSSRNGYATLLLYFVREKGENITFDEIISFLNGNMINYTKIVSIFADRYKISIKKDEIDEFIKTYLKNESDNVFNYIVDMSARKEFLEEEVLKLKKIRQPKIVN